MEMEISEKIKRATTLEQEIEYIKDFVSLARHSQEVDEKNARSNELSGVNRFDSLYISSRISTGSQSPSYKKNLINDAVIKEFVNAGLPVLERILEEKNKELNSLFRE